MAGWDLKRFAEEREAHIENVAFILEKTGPQVVSEALGLMDAENKTQFLEKAISELDDETLNSLLAKRKAKRN